MSTSRCSIVSPALVLVFRKKPIVLYVNEYHSLMPSDEKKQYRCEQCGIYFDSLEEFTRHDKEKHLE
jgi:hypothetical protein